MMLAMTEVRMLSDIQLLITVALHLFEIMYDVKYLLYIYMIVMYSYMIVMYSYMIVMYSYMIVMYSCIIVLLFTIFGPTIASI